MRKFTDKELGLAPQVAEAMGFACVDIATDKDDIPHNLMPLEHDCLEWLRGQDFSGIKIRKFTWKPWIINCIGFNESTKEIHIVNSGRGDTLLEALYRCIIEIGNE